jgi:hypothetical protein
MYDFSGSKSENPGEPPVALFQHIMESGRIREEPAHEGAFLGPSRGISVKLDLILRDQDGNVTGEYHCEHDMTLKQLAQGIQEALMAVTLGAGAMLDTGGVTRTVAAGSAGTLPTIHFGIGTTAAAFADNKIQTTAGAAPDIITAVVNALSANTFTVTATWTNTTAGTIAISELAMEVTIATFIFAITHDVFTGQNVSASGTAAATLTFTFT